MALCAVGLVACGHNGESEAPQPTVETFETGSSFITEVAYERPIGDELGTLIVTMGDRSYSYAEVPPSVWAEMQQAESVGAYYNANIKDIYSPIQ